MTEDVPRFVHDSSYPDGWEKRQYDDLARVLDAEPENVDIAMLDGVPVGGVCPGIGRAHTEHPYRRARAAGRRWVRVAPGRDRGHAPARATYEAEGFVRWPVARYFKDLAPQETDDAEA